MRTCARALLRHVRERWAIENLTPRAPGEHDLDRRGHRGRRPRHRPLIRLLGWREATPEMQ